MSEWVGFLGGAVLWLKAAHIIFAIFLIAGLFMLPRFFIYHQQVAVDSAEDKQWLEREDRLRRIILNPSLIIVWILGLLLAFHGGHWSSAWFLIKFAVLLVLSGYHGWAIGYYKALQRGERRLSEKKLRMLNEIPGLATALIVILATVRPWS